MDLRIKEFLENSVKARFEIAHDEDLPGNLDSSTQVVDLKDAYLAIVSERFYCYRGNDDVAEYWSRLRDRESETALDILSEGCSQLFLFLRAEGEVWNDFLRQTAEAICACRVSWGDKEPRNPIFLSDEDFHKHVLTVKDWIRILEHNPWVGYAFHLTMCQINFARHVGAFVPVGRDS